MRSSTIAPLLVVILATSSIRAAESRVRFEANHGQADARWAFVARAGGAQVLVGESDVRLGSATLALADADTAAVWEALEPLPGQAHYLIGTDPAKWIRDVPTSRALIRRGVYPGIDAVVRGTSRRMTLELIVAPGADASVIALRADGGQPHAPVVDGVTTSFLGSAAGLRIQSQRERRTEPQHIQVAIDLPETPVASEPPRLGIDAEGRLYVAGRVTTEPATAFVSQLDPTGRDVIRTTYVDGFDPASPLSLAVAPNGELVLAADTTLVHLDREGRAIVQRTSLPGTALATAVADGSAWVAGRAGTDAFVAKIDAAGVTSFLKTFGAAGVDEVRAIAPRDGSVYLTGSTTSPEFLGSSSLGGRDGFVVKIDAKTGALVFARPIGGTGDDDATAIAVSPEGEIVVAGTTRSTDLPVSKGSFGGGSDAFLARLDGRDGSLRFATYVGGPLDDRAEALALDRRDRAWIAGSRGDDAFVTRLPLGSRGSAWNDLIAGDREDAASGIVLDANGDAKVAGFTRSTRLPAGRPELTRGGDVFIASLPGHELSPNGVCPGTKNFLGTNSNAWEDPGNWSDSSLPTSSDDVCISGFDVTIGSGSRDAGTLRVETGSLTIGAATLTVAGTSEVQGDLTIDGGTLTGAGDVTISGTFTWTGGELSGGGTTTANGPVSLAGAPSKNLVAHTLSTTAPVTWTGAGNLDLSTGAIVNSSGTWDCQSDATVTYGGGASPTFNTSGTFKKSAGAGATAVQVPFVNTGAVSVESGTLKSSAGGSSTGGSFAVAATTTLEFDGGSYTLSTGTTFSGAGNVRLSGATVTAIVAVSVPAGLTVDMTGGILTGGFTFTIGGTLNWSGGTMSGTGTTACNGPLNISGSSVKTIQTRTLNTAAATTFAGTGNLTLSSGAIVVNNNIWDCQNDATISQGSGAAPSFTNNHTFKKTTLTGTSTMAVPFTNNFGTVSVETGTIRVNAGGTNNGPLTTAAGTTFRIGGGTFTLGSGSALTGSGTFLLSGGTLTANTNTTVASTATFDMDGGVLTGLLDLIVNGTLNWTAGGMSSLGDTICNGPLNISGSQAKALSRRLQNKATATWSGFGLTVSGGGVIENSGTWDCQGDGVIAFGGGSASAFENTGTIKKTAGAGTSAIQFPFVTSGTVDVQTGTLSMTNFTQSVGTTKLNGGSLQTPNSIIVQGGTLSGSGTVTGQILVTNSGSLAPGLSLGTINVVGGDYLQTSTVAPGFAVEIGGLAANQYDRATISGQAQIGGVLSVSLINGFVPNPGDTFTVMTYGSLVGGYNINNASTSCIGWEPTFGATALTLTARALPREINGLVLDGTKTNLQWTPAPAYTGTTYQVLRGDLSTLPVGPAGDFCLNPGGSAATSIADASIPAVGTGYWYVVREKIPGCGVGTYGFATGGVERTSSSCP